MNKLNLSKVTFPKHMASRMDISLEMVCSPKLSVYSSPIVLWSPGGWFSASWLVLLNETHNRIWQRGRRAIPSQFQWRPRELTMFLVTVSDCYGLSVSTTWIPTCWHLEVGLWVWLYHEDGALMTGISTLSGRGQRTSSFSFWCVRIEDASSLQPRRGLSPEPTMLTPSSWTSTLQNCDKNISTTYKCIGL